MITVACREHAAYQVHAVSSFAIFAIIIPSDRRCSVGSI
jgi:hypothetical protein